MRKADIKRSIVTEIQISIGKSFKLLGAAWLNARRAVTVLWSTVYGRPMQVRRKIETCLPVLCELTAD